jgi:hypothetical protein
MKILSREKAAAKARILFYAAVLFLIPAFIYPWSYQPKSRERIFDYLPNKNELQMWNPIGQPQTAQGEDLFQLINGGAEIYHEYGFKNAIIQSYTHENGLSLNIEIYEMEDAVSAYGVFSFKTGSQGQKTDVGTEAVLEDYYLNFWKGNLVVTLIGFDTSQATQQALMEFAQIIESKLPDSEEDYPPLIKFIKSRFPGVIRTVYLEGNLALYNQYEFDTENIFGIKKGAAAYFSDHTLFIFEYRNKGEAQAWFQNAREHLSQNPRFHGYEKSAEEILFQDKKDNSLFISPFQNHILIYMGKDIEKAPASLIFHFQKGKDTGNRKNVLSLDILCELQSSVPLSFFYPLLQTRTFDIFHSHEGFFILIPYFIHSANIGMTERGGSLGFTNKLFYIFFLLHTPGKNKFQSHCSVELGIMGFIHHSHPTRTHFLKYFVMRNSLSDHYNK